MLGILTTRMDAMTSFITQHGYLALAIIGVLTSACIPLPTEAAFGLGGALASAGFGGMHHLSLAWVIIWATFGSVIGSIISYEVGRSLGRTIVDRYGKWLLLTHKDLDAADRFFAKYGAWSVLIGRVIPVVRSFISIPAGLGEMKRIRFIVISAIGNAAWASLLSGLGYAAGSHWEKVSKDFRPFVYPIAAVVVIAVAAFFWHRIRSIRRQNAA